jgi:hypothetical protein
VPEGLDIAYMYASTFRVSFADMGEWNRLWSEVVAPILEQAMNEGLLGGWVRLEHNTGGPHNSKVLYMFDSWDDIDDLFGATRCRGGKDLTQRDFAEAPAA